MDAELKRCNAYVDLFDVVIIGLIRARDACQET